MTSTRCSPPYAPESHTRTSTPLSHPAVRSAGRFALPGTKTKIEEEFQGRSPAYLQTHKEECYEARMYTLGSAFHSFDEDKLGSIELGKLADLAVLSDDPLSVSDDKLKRLRSVLTLQAGRIVRGEAD